MLDSLRYSQNGWDQSLKKIQEAADEFNARIAQSSEPKEHTPRETYGIGSETSIESEIEEAISSDQIKRIQTIIERELKNLQDYAEYAKRTREELERPGCCSPINKITWKIGLNGAIVTATRIFGFALSVSSQSPVALYIGLGIYATGEGLDLLATIYSTKASLTIDRIKFISRVNQEHLQDFELFNRFLTEMWALQMLAEKNENLSKGSPPRKSNPNLNSKGSISFSEMTTNIQEDNLESDFHLGWPPKAPVETKDGIEETAPPESKDETEESEPISPKSSPERTKKEPLKEAKFNQQGRNTLIYNSDKTMKQSNAIELNFSRKPGKEQTGKAQEYEIELAPCSSEKTDEQKLNELDNQAKLCFSSYMKLPARFREDKEAYSGLVSHIINQLPLEHPLKEGIIDLEPTIHENFYHEDEDIKPTASHLNYLNQDETSNDQKNIRQSQDRWEYAKEQAGSGNPLAVSQEYAFTPKSSEAIHNYTQFLQNEYGITAPTSFKSPNGWTILQDGSVFKTGSAFSG